jgi:hypothetical protein
VLGVLFALLLALGVVVPDRAGEVAVAPPVGERGHVQARATRAVASAAAVFGLTADLHVVVYEMGGNELEFTSVRVGPVEGVTDEHGYVELDRVPWGIHDVVLGGDFVAEPSFASVFGSEQTVLAISAYRSCPGRIRVVEADGTPVAGVEVWVQGPQRGTKVADDEGWLDLDPEDRICGTQTYLIHNPGEGSGPSMTATIENGDPLILTMPTTASAELWIVDRDDAFLDAEITGGRYNFEATWLATGRYEIRAAGSIATVRVSDGGLASLVTVPLDGSIHLARVGDTVDVSVHARCEADGCPPIQSNAGQCDEQAPGDFVCPCDPDGDSIIAEQPERRYTHIAAGQTEATLDLRDGRATIRGMWTGRLPVDIAASGNGGGAMDSLASFEFSIDPGPRDILFVDAEHHTARRSVDLAPNEVLDLGSVGPESKQTVVGSVVADFPLPAEVCETNGSVACSEVIDGSFSLDVPSAWSSVTLSLHSPEYGAFRATFPTGAPIEWDVSWQMDRRGLSDEDIAGVMIANEDTGVGIDSGVY